MKKKKQKNLPALSTFESPSLKVSTVEYNKCCELCGEIVDQKKVEELLKCIYCNVVVHITCAVEGNVFDESDPKDKWKCHFCLDTIEYEKNYRKVVEAKKEEERKELLAQIVISKHWRGSIAQRLYRKIVRGVAKFQRLYFIYVRKRLFSVKKQQFFRPIKLIIHSITDLYMTDRDPRRSRASFSNPQSSSNSNSPLPALKNLSPEQHHHQQPASRFLERDLPIYLLIHVMDLSSGTFVQAWRNETSLKILPNNPNHLYSEILFNEDFLLGGVTGFHHVVLTLFQKGHSGKELFIGQSFLELSTNMAWKRGGKHTLPLHDCSYVLRDNTGMEIKCDTRGYKPMGNIVIELSTAHGMNTWCGASHGSAPDEFIRALGKFPMESIPGYIIIQRSLTNSTSLSIVVEAANNNQNINTKTGDYQGKSPPKKNQKKADDTYLSPNSHSSPPPGRKLLSPLRASSLNAAAAATTMSPSSNSSLTPLGGSSSLYQSSLSFSDDASLQSLSSSSLVQSSVSSMSKLSLTRSATAKSISAVTTTSGTVEHQPKKSSFKCALKKIWIVIFSEKLYIFNHYGDQLKLILDLKYLIVSYELSKTNKKKIIYNLKCPTNSRVPAFSFSSYYDHDGMNLKCTMISSLILAKKLVLWMESVMNSNNPMMMNWAAAQQEEEEAAHQNNNRNRRPSSSTNHNHLHSQSGKYHSHAHHDGGNESMSDLGSSDDDEAVVGRIPRKSVAARRSLLTTPTAQTPPRSASSPLRASQSSIPPINNSNTPGNNPPVVMKLSRRASLSNFFSAYQEQLENATNAANGSSKPGTPSAPNTGRRGGIVPLSARGTGGGGSIIPLSARGTTSLGSMSFDEEEDHHGKKSRQVSRDFTNNNNVNDDMPFAHRKVSQKKLSSHPYINQFFDFQAFVLHWRQLDYLVKPNHHHNNNSQHHGLHAGHGHGHGHSSVGGSVAGGGSIDTARHRQHGSSLVSKSASFHGSLPAVQSPHGKTAPSPRGGRSRSPTTIRRVKTTSDLDEQDSKSARRLVVDRSGSESENDESDHSRGSSKKESGKKGGVIRSSASAIRSSSSAIPLIIEEEEEDEEQKQYQNSLMQPRSFKPFSQEI
jgi:hypothetical protein